MSCDICSVSLSNLSHHVVVDGCWIKLFDPSSSIHCYEPALVPHVALQLYAYADDSAFVALVPSRDEKVVVCIILNCDLNRVVEWCGLWGLKLNAKKTKTIISL